MTTRIRMTAALVALASMVAGCGGSDEPQATTTTAAPAATTATTTTAPPATTTTVAATTTTGQPEPTTTTKAPLPDAADLLAAMNAAMSAGPEFLGTGRGFVKETADTADADAFVTQLAVGGGPAGGDFWQLMLLEFDTPGLQQTFYVQQRTVDGVEYRQEPTTGVWIIDDSSDPDPVADAFAGTLQLTDATVKRSVLGYLVTGSYPADPMVDSVAVDIDRGSSRLRRIEVVGRTPRSELQGLVSAAGDDLVLTQRIDVTTYSLDVAEIVAPPVDVATRLIPNPEAPFMTSIPTDWVQFSVEELDAAGFTDGYVAPSGVMVLVLLEYLEGTGITTIGQYADAVASVALAGFDITYFDAATTLQGGAAWLISGTDPDVNAEFRRLLYVSADGIAVNLTFVQGEDPETGEPTAAWADSQALVDFMINSFLVNQ